MSETRLKEGFRLQDWRVLPMEGELHGPEGTQRVEPKVMRLLLCLADRAGQAVDHETIITEVWDGRAISDEALFRCVAELRKKLGDSSSAPTYVQTVHKIGYRLIVPVQALLADTERRPANDDATTDSSIPGWSYPSRFDGLEIIRLLDSGSMADVYLAREFALERLVAVKTFLADANVDDNARRRLLREARAAARLVHPNVTAIYRVGELPDGAPYIVQQFIDGQNLAEIMDVEGPMRPERACNTLRQLAAALAAAHEKRIIHRDVKPANILVDGADHVYLSDFGLAGLQESGDGDATRLTLAGELLGDPRFISPEQARGEPVTPLCDIYSLGIVAFMLFSGRYPYDDEESSDPLMLHIRATPLDLSSVQAGIPDGVARIVHRCLEKEPRRRPSAEQLVRLLDSAIATMTMNDSNDRKEPVRPAVSKRLQIAAVLMLVAAAVTWLIVS